MDSIRTPLSISVPIVDPETGNPTPFFQRIMQVLLEQKEITDALAEGAAPASRILTAGAGLTGGGDLTADRTFDVGAGTGIIVNANDVAADPEYIMDTINSMLVAGSNITLTYNDGANTLTIAASGGGSSAWTTVADWQFSVSGAVATVVSSDLSSYNELLVYALGAGRSVAGQHQLQVSTDGGATYYTTSGNYLYIDANGVTSNQTGFTVMNASVTAARNWSANILNLKGVAKMAHLITQTTFPNWSFNASTSDITHVRATATVAGNYNAGRIIMLAR